MLERFRVTPDEAFGLLAIASQNSNRTLRDIAAELVRTGEVPLPPSRTGRG